MQLLSMHYIPLGKNVSCMSKKCVYRPFLFERTTFSGEAFIDMLDNCLKGELHEEEPENFVFQQDGAQTH